MTSNTNPTSAPPQRQRSSEPKIGYNPGDIRTPVTQIRYDPSRRAEVERSLVVFDSFTRNGDGFCRDTVGRWFEPVEMGWSDADGREVKVSESEEGEGRKVAGCRFVVTITVNKDMCNMFGTLHGGCTSYMFDVITTAAGITATGVPRVSVNLNVSFFRSASVGTNLKLTGYTSSVGKFIAHLRGEMWDADRNVLLASCVHTMADPKMGSQGLSELASSSSPKAQM